MKRITTLTDNSYQQISFVTESGKELDMVFRYLPRQYYWVVDITYNKKFVLNGIRICCHPNLLDKWHNILDFGINVTTDDGLDPMTVDCFSSNYCFFCILNNEEKNQATEYLNGL